MLSVGLCSELSELPIGINEEILLLEETSVWLGDAISPRSPCEEHCIEILRRLHDGLARSHWVTP